MNIYLIFSQVILSNREIQINYYTKTYLFNTDFRFLITIVFILLIMYNIELYIFKTYENYNLKYAFINWKYSKMTLNSLNMLKKIWNLLFKKKKIFDLLNGKSNFKYKKTKSLLFLVWQSNSNKIIKKKNA